MKILPSIEIFSVENTIEKEQKKKLKKRFQNKCVSSQNKREKEEGAAVDSSAILPYLSSAGSFVFSSGRRAVNRDKSKPSGNTHKIPEKT